MSRVSSLFFTNQSPILLSLELKFLALKKLILHFFKLLQLLFIWLIHYQCVGQMKLM